MVFRRVVEADLVDLLPPVRGYCDFNDADRGDDELLMISRALIAEPEREGLQIIARGSDGRAIGFATLVWTWATWTGGASESWAISSLRRLRAGPVSGGS